MLILRVDVLEAWCESMKKFSQKSGNEKTRIIQLCSFWQLTLLTLHLVCGSQNLIITLGIQMKALGCVLRRRLNFLDVVRIDKGRRLRFAPLIELFGCVWWTFDGVDVHPCTRPVSTQSFPHKLYTNHDFPLIFRGNSH